MSFIVETNSTPRPLAPTGTQLARLIQIVDLGTHKEESVDQKTGAKSMKDRRKVRFVWELPNKKAIFRDGGKEEPFTLGGNYTLSLDKKANLSAIVEGIIGRPLGDSERKAFDISKLLGEGSLLTVLPHTKRDGNLTVKIGGTSPLMDGQEVPPTSNPTVLYQVRDGRNEVFNTFPEWLQEEITSSHEFQRAA